MTIVTPIIYQLTAMIVTHNMKQAIEYGNRLLMMDEGGEIRDVHGEEKKQLIVPKLIDILHIIRKKD